MRNTLLLFSFLAATVLFMANQDGALPENTGAPGELTCGRAPCHNIPANIGTAQINIKVADSIFQYQADSTYLVRIQITNPLSAKNGFEILALNAAEQNVGQWILQEPLKTQIKSGIGLPQRKYVTHKAAGNQQTEWFVKWKAPAVGSSDVTLYASVLSANNNNLNTGDQLYTTSTKLSFSTVSTQSLDYKAQIRVYPNPATEHFRILNNSPMTIVEATLYAQDGRLVRIFSAPVEGSNFSVADLPRGVYILKLRGQDRSVFQKIIVE